MSHITPPKGRPAHIAGLMKFFDIKIENDIKKSYDDQKSITEIEPIIF